MNDDRYRSDIILGGGVDIRVSNGIGVQVAQGPDDAGQLTIQGKPVNVRRLRFVPKTTGLL